MIAAYEKIGHSRLVWAVAKTDHDARILASNRHERILEERPPTIYWDVCDADPKWEKKCGPDVELWETILV